MSPKVTTFGNNNHRDAKPSKAYLLDDAFILSSRTRIYVKVKTIWVVSGISQSEPEEMRGNPLIRDNGDDKKRVPRERLLRTTETRYRASADINGATDRCHRSR